MFWAVPLPIIRSFPLYIRHWYMSCKFDDSFQSRPGWTWLKAVIKLAWHIPVRNVQWKTPDDGQRNCPKHAEFLDKNKFGKISAPFGFIKKQFVTMHGHTHVFTYHRYLSTLSHLSGTVQMSQPLCHFQAESGCSSLILIHVKRWRQQSAFILW